MSLTVVPAYRIIKRFVRDVEGLAYDEMLDTLEAKVRTYVHHLLAGTSSSYAELGQRTALTQLGDPDLDVLVHALDTIEAGGPKAIVEEALQRCAQALPRPDLTARVVLLPGDGQSRVLTSQMKGVIGFSLGAQVTILILWPTREWKQWTAYTVSHEYAHLVRNLLFPRSMVGSKLIYQKSQEPETLLDAMVAEGIADAFAMELHAGMEPPWTRALSPEAAEQIWPKVRRRLHVSDTTEIRRFLFGDNDRIPVWTGYTVGYRVVRGYLNRHPAARPASLLGLSGKTIFEASGYQPGLVSAQGGDDELP